MKMVINNNRKIFALQKEFSELFPGLKIVFFAKPSKPGAPPSIKLVKQGSKTLQECRAIHHEGIIEILPTMDISEIKENFRDLFGLSVEIIQKSGEDFDERAVIEKLTILEINDLYAL
jgi:hypothetical protein